MSVAKRVDCRAVVPGPDPSKVVLVATGDSVTAAHEQQGFSADVCFGNTTWDHRELVGSNGKFSYAGKYFDMNPNVVDYYNFARTGFSTTNIMSAQKDVTEDGCGRKWGHGKSALGMAMEAVTNAKRAGYSAHYVSTGGINDTNWLGLLQHVTICRGLETIGNIRSWYSANGGGGKERIVPHGGTCYAIACCGPYGIPILAAHNIPPFNGDFLTTTFHVMKIVKGMLDAGADRVVWMLYYDMTPAHVDINAFLRQYAGRLGPALRAIILARINPPKEIPLIDPALHPAVRTIQNDLNAAITNRLNEQLTANQMQKVRVVIPPVFEKRDIQNTAIGGSPHPSNDGHTKLAQLLYNATEASNTFALRSRANGRYVTPFWPGAPMIAGVSTVLPSAMFHVKDLGADKVALMSLANYRYVTAEDAGRKPLIARAAVVGQWETYLKRRNDDGSISLRAEVNGLWVTAGAGGNQQLIASKAQPAGNEEKFDLVTMSQVKLFNRGIGHYFSARDGWVLVPGFPLSADTLPVNSWQAFRWDDQGGGRYALFSYANNRYVSASANGLLMPTGDPAAVGQSETFNVGNDGNGSMVMSVWSMGDRRYVTAGPGGQHPLRASSRLPETRSELFQWNYLPTVALRARVNNKYVVVDEADISKVLVANKEAADLKQLHSNAVFYYIDKGNGEVSLYSLANNKYITAGFSAMRAEADRPLSNESFELLRNPNGSVSFKQLGRVRGIATGGPDAATEFDLVTIPAVALIARVNDQLVTANSGGILPLTASGSSVNANQTFYKIDLGGGRIALQAYINDRYVVAPVPGGTPQRLIADALQVGPWETFLVESNGDGSVSLKASNGKFLTVVPDIVHRTLKASATLVGDMESFDLIPIR